MFDWRKLLAGVPGANAGVAAPYRVFTREFDVEVGAGNLPEALASASPDKPKWRDTDGSGWGEAQSLTDRFAEKQEAPDATLRAVLGSHGSDFAVTLLVDQSGSMKGEPIAAIVAALAAFEAALSAAEVQTEVLGFSTAGWHGGFARAKWLKAGRPRRPGRLCALMHIVYKSASENLWSTSSQRAMLHPDILRENVDGEALAWAAARMTKGDRRYKLLVVLSDGAPVDDSTLRENSNDYLERDVRRVIREIEEAGVIQLGALGIGHEVDRYYSLARGAEIATILPSLTALFSQLVERARAESPLI
ncbi:cobaltochelatase CobT-related protein [Sphingomonas hengshuiensis]|uniref:cobaltochelatase CobT-related protein n=1 Tax=Sphingomonas hengshuiensis TaxID=1609977 RepID=UPI000695E837|nr:hypothetical protein [Sphingomonas hengshuiensis]